MKTKKIAIIYSGAKQWGGVETYIGNLFKYVNSGEIELSLLSIGNWPLVHNLKNYNPQIIESKWWNFFNLFKIIKLLKTNKSDLIVSQGMVANFYARKISILTKIPNLVVAHSDWKFDYSGFKKVMFWISDRLLRFATKKNIAVSEYLKEQLINDGIRADKIEVIYNGVKISNKSKIRNQNNKSLVIGSIGRLHPSKNFGELITAMKETKDAKLLIYGDGLERENLQRKINELGVSGRVKLLGAIEQKKIPEALSGMDIYIQPSLSEGFGLTVIEAMLAGLPVIVTPGGALPELVENKKTGIVTNGFGSDDLTKAIELYLKESKIMKEYSEAGRKSAAERFNINKWSDNITAAFLEISK